MLILIIFAFLGGIVTILSPCILPILPIVLSGSLTGGKRRPLGIITGFILSFTFFTLFLTTLVKLLGFSADFLRSLSVVVVFGFGLSLLIPRFQLLTERLFTKLTPLAKSRNNREGFSGGLLVGLSLGLVWTPCVGPILAAIITLAATSTVTLTAVFITLAYATGTAIPLLAITSGGRQVLLKNAWLLKNSAKVQKTFGILMLLTALGIYLNVDRRFQTWILTKFPQYGTGLTGLEDNTQVREALEKLKEPNQNSLKKGQPMFDLLKENLGAAPDFTGGTGWLNSSPLTIASLRGKVVLVDFWTYTCINCIRTLPYITSWYQKYKDKGLVIIGVHTPEFEFEKKAENVAKAIKDFGITYPVVQDNDYKIWTAYANRYWPAKYFIDKDGVIRKTHFGEGDYDDSEMFIQKLLAETGVSVAEPVNNPTYQTAARTPETYLGYARMQYFSSLESVQRDAPMVYSASADIPNNTFAFAGTWTVGAEYSTPTTLAALLFHFEAKEVFLVMRPRSAPGQIKVTLDNHEVGDAAGIDVKAGIVTVDSDRLYKLIKLNEPGNHLLNLEFLDSNTEVYAFTFG